MILYISVRLKELRKIKGYTQQQVAKYIGITRCMISSYENDIRLPSYDILLKLAELYGVTVDYLLRMEPRRYVDITGLTDKQAAVIHNLVEVFKEDNT